VVALRMWLDKRRRLREILQKREARLYRQLEARKQGGWYIEGTFLSQPVVTWVDVEEVFRRPRAR
jgi:hypothetical protein